MGALKNANLHAEHFKYADDKLAVLMSILINAMIVHDFVQVDMLDTIIVPILKDKLGDICDQENYRPLALTCASSKLFKLLVLHRYEYSYV